MKIRVDAKCGPVAIDMSDAMAKAMGMSRKQIKAMRDSFSRPMNEQPWYVWPNDMTALKASSLGLLRGPFDTPEEAMLCAANAYWELVPQ